MNKEYPIIQESFIKHRILIYSHKNHSPNTDSQLLYMIKTRALPILLGAPPSVRLPAASLNLISDAIKGRTPCNGTQSRSG